MTVARRAISVLWPMVLLIAFLATFRRAADDPAVRADAADPTQSEQLLKAETAR